MSRARTLVVAALAVGGLGLAAAVLHARESAFPQQPVAERLLYLRSGRTADRLMLSFDAMAADIYWIRTIQHYGRDRKAAARPDRFALVYPLLDLTTTLDPYFNIAYRLGWIFLSMPAPDGPGRTDLAIQLLEKGLRARPDRWHYAYDAGFVHYWYTGDFSEAARWFERAASMPNAPVWLKPLAATARAQGGDRGEARRMLASLLESQEQYIRAAAERGLAQLQALDAIDELEKIVADFNTEHGRYPTAEELQRRIGGVPLDAAGRPFVYDPATHTVSVAPDSPLQPLPRTMIRR